SCARCINDPKAQERRIPTLLEEEGREDGQASQSRHVQDASGRGEAREGRAVLQAAIGGRDARITYDAPALGACRMGGPAPAPDALASRSVSAGRLARVRARPWRGVRLARPPEAAPGALPRLADARAGRSSGSRRV